MSYLETTTRPKARKVHCCAYCNATILLGDTYHRTVWLGTGECLTTKVCDECATISKDLYALGYSDETDYGTECYPYLPDVYYWDEIRERSSEWSARVDAYMARLKGVR